MLRRMIVLACAFVAAPVQAQEPAEKLLSPTTQLYIRWDGVAPHREAYRNSALGDALAGPTGDTLRTLIAKVPKLLGSTLLADPLLNGKSPDELKAVHADLRHAEKLLEILADHGLVLAAEVNEPRPTLRGIGKAFGNLLGGNAPAPESFLPDGRVFLIVPDVGDKSESLFAAFRLAMRQSKESFQPLPPTAAKKGFAFISPSPDSAVKVGWWLEGKHFVFYMGSVSIETAAAGLRENQKKNGLTQHALYRRCLKTGDFESVARGYIDTGNVVSLAKRLAGPFVPGLAEKVDAIGVGNLQAIVFSSGFKGKESRALYELDLPGERRGLAKILKPAPVTLKDLPPLPPDVSRFSMLRIDPSGLYEAGLVAFDTASAGESFGVEDEGKSPEEIAKLRKAYLERELVKFLGLDVKNDLLPHLGDRFVMYQTPTEGLSVFGTVICISVKDAGKVKAATDRLQRGLESIAGPVKLRRKLLGGVEIREIYSRGFGVVTPTYAVVGDWLVIGGHPQTIQGFVLRHKGDIEKWKPDAATAARIEKMPADAIGIQYCNPKSVVHNLCCIGPLFLTTINRFNRPDSGDFDPIDIGLIPNAHELGKRLFPNLTYTRDDGKTVRIEVNDSFSLPGEFVGFETVAFAIVTGLLRF